MSEVKLPTPAGAEQYRDQLEVLVPFMQEMIKHAYNPPGSDERIAAYAQATIEHIQEPENEKFRSYIIEDLVNNGKEGEELPLKPNKLLRIAQKYALRDDWSEDPKNPKFPEQFDDKQAWRKIYEWALDGGDREGEFSYDLRFRNVTSNIPQRYFTIPFAVEVMRAVEPKRFEGPIRALDAGCSQNLGLRKLALNSPFSQVRVMKDNKNGTVQDKAATEIINSLVTPDFPIEDSWGADKVPVWDPLAREWTIASSGYTSEFLNPAREAEYAFLYSNDETEQVNFTVWDFTKDAQPGNSEFPEKHFDVIFASYALYLVAAGRPRKDAMNNLMRYAKDDALVIWQEPAYLSKKNALRFYPDLYAKPYRNNAHVIDMASTSRKTELFISFESGRSRVAKLGPVVLKNMAKLKKSVAAREG